MIISIGEILFDIFPEYKRMGGAPFNFAFHLKSLDFPVIFISRIGNDENGESILQSLKEKNFDLKYIQKDYGRATGHVNVSIDEYGIPEFDIVKDTAYDNIDYSDEIISALKLKPRLIYYGTLIQRTAKGADTIMKLLEKRDPQTLCFYDINLRPHCYDKNAITKSLIHCNVLKLNDEELSILASMFGSGPTDRESFINDLMLTFSIEWLCLTSGDKGSALFTRDGSYTAGPDREFNIKDTVGAGDAYASILAAGYILQWPPDLILKRASMFAGAICECRGAVPEDPLFYRQFSDWIKQEDFDER